MKIKTTIPIYFLLDQDSSEANIDWEALGMAPQNNSSLEGLDVVDFTFYGVDAVGPIKKDGKMISVIFAGENTYFSPLTVDEVTGLVDKSIEDFLLESVIETVVADGDTEGE